MNQEDEKRNFFYPSYVPSVLHIKGLKFYELFAGIAAIGIPMFLFQPYGVVIGLMLGAGVLFVCVRIGGARENFLQQMQALIRYFTSPRLIHKKERVDVDKMMDDIEAQRIAEQAGLSKKELKRKKKLDSKKGKKAPKQSKKQKKKKEQYMQDYFGFKSVLDNCIKMEDGRIFLFLRIQANNMNFLSFREVDELMISLGKSFDRNRFKVAYKIQDSVFDVKKNVRVARKAEARTSVLFLKRLANEIASFIHSQKKEATKKASYLRVTITGEELKNQSLEEIKNKVKKSFKNTLNPMDTSQLELKQMLGIYGNHIFSDVWPDSEMEYEDEYDRSLLTKRKVTYEDQQLPGIYEFKDMITPNSCVFRPSDATIGSHLVRTYSVESFIAVSDETNILSQISTLKGVSTSIYVDDLSLQKFKNYVKLDVRARNSSAADEIDEIDKEVETESTKATYKRIKKSKQKMYYASILFQLHAIDKQSLEALEQKFLENCDEVGLSVDPLKARQREGWMSCNPIGDNQLANFIKQNIPSESLANLYPFNDPSVLDNEGLPIGNIVDRLEVVLYDMFQYRGSNLNVLILGYSGMGKTILLWLLLQNEAIKGSYIRNIDIEGTCVEFIEKLGGININMAGNNEYCINPLHIRIPDEIQSGIVDDYVSEVKNFMSIYKSSWPERILDVFEHYVSMVYAKFNITNTTNFQMLKSKDMPLMEDVYALVDHDRLNYDPKKCIGSEEDLQSILIGMNSMVNGADSKLFNRHTNLGNMDSVRMEDEQLMNFDLKDMMNSSLDRKLAQWSNVFTYIAQFVNGNMGKDKKIAVAVDELHTFLKKQYIPIVDIIETYERRFRKYKASFIKASQTIDEFNEGEEELRSKVKVLFNQSGVKFLFHLGDIDYQITKDLLNLKQVEIDTLKEPRNGKCLMRIGSVVYDLEVMMPEWFAEVKHDVEKVAVN